MNSTPDFQDFFIAGGTLPPDAPSYVKRGADEELFRHIMVGEFCYVLTPRQMGKSSLMIQTIQRLQNEGIKSAIVDLTVTGTVENEGQWYKGILTQIKRRLRLKIDPVVWWEQREDIPVIQKFIEFFEVILAEVDGRIVIFVDEIDTTLNLGFRDDFFAGIRSIYNRRAEQGVLRRLSFVLLGVASPTDLISDKARTPFNVGYAISLNELRIEDAKALQNELERIYPKSGKKILERIFYWTNGHPYLTQKLCKEIVESDKSNWNRDEIDLLVKELFLSNDARKETNLKFIQDIILNDEKHEELLLLYKRILSGESVVDDNQSIIHSKIKISGLTHSSNGLLVINNQIYREVFNLDWTEQNLPRRTQLLPIIVTERRSSSVLINFINSPLVIGVFFSLYAVFVRLYLYPRYSFLLAEDLNLIQNFIEWFGVAYGLLVALVLVNVWSNFDVLEKEFDREADAILMLFQAVNKIKETPKTRKIKQHIINSIKDYVSHINESYLVEHIKPKIKDVGDYILEKTQNGIAHVGEKEIIDFELYRMLNDVIDIRSNRISLSKKRMPKPIWGVSLAASILWLIPFYALNFRNDWVAIILGGGVTAIVVAILVVIRDLDDPFTGTWRINNTEWAFLGEKLDLKPTLFFVYSIENVRIYKVFAFINKTFFSKQLCSLYSLFSDTEKQRRFLDELSDLAYLQIYYKDEFEALYERIEKLPAIIFKSAVQMQILIDPDEINEIANLTDLKRLIKERFLTIASKG